MFALWVFFLHSLLFCPVDFMKLKSKKFQQVKTHFSHIRVEKKRENTKKESERERASKDLLKVCYKVWCFYNNSWEQYSKLKGTAWESEWVNAWKSWEKLSRAGSSSLRLGLRLRLLLNFAIIRKSIKMPKEHPTVWKCIYCNPIPPFPPAVYTP